MPAPGDSHTIKIAANELNNLLQVMSGSVQALYNAARNSPEAGKHYDIARDCIQRSAATVRMMIDELARHEGLSAAAGDSPAARQISAMERTPAAPPRPGQEQASIVNPEGTLELVMVVDDEELICKQTERVLVSQGYRVICASDPLRAIAMYRKFHKEIALVILDFTMPVMDGSEVFEELRAVNQRVPVVLSSGFAEQDKLKAMLSKGLRGFLPKPYTPQKLLGQVRSTLDALKRERSSQ
jgi:CheY-like chemotaxis protein